METVNFKAAQLGEELKNIISRTNSMLEESNCFDVKRKLESELNSLNERGELRIAFVGQYSSGKSTIISALTGNRDIKISANVETDVVSEYRWNNIVLLDTPGIQAGKVELHDLRTKEALNGCDLIVYVLTSQLFDDVIFENFLDLAYNQHLDDKMLIAINKMSKEHGDFKELSDNYMQSMRTIFSERGFYFNFPVVFIDAKDYIEGTEDDDEDFIQLSNFKTFIDQLNNFVDERGLIKKQFDTPIRILKDNLSDVAISNVDPTLMDIYTHYISKIKKCMHDIEMDTRLLADSFEESAVAKANEVSLLIGQVDQKELEEKSDNLSKEINGLVVDFTKDVEQKANDNYDELMNDMSEFVQKDSMVMYMSDVDSKIASPSISDYERKNLEGQRRFLDMLSQGGQKVSSMSGIQSLSGIAQASGSQMHNIVYSVGKFFGHNFKPWEAVNTAAKIGKIGKFGVPVITTAISIGLDIKQKRAEEKRIKEIKVARDNYDANVRKSIKDTRRKLEIEVRDSILANYDNKLNEINQMKLELGRTISSNKAIQEKIAELAALYDYFLGQINLRSEVDEQTPIIL
jgi:GTPase SAR1 family protein